MMTLEERVRRLEALNRKAPPTSAFMAIPGLVGFWPMSNVDVSSGDAYDASGQGRRLTYNGNPTYNVYNDIVSYIDLDGTGDYLSLADASDLDISGTETQYATDTRGLTMGGWFWSDSISTQYALMGKYLSTGNQRSYWIQFLGSVLVGAVSSNGTAETTVTHTSTLSTGAWYFCIQRYDPSTSLDAFVNGVEVSNTSSIPSSIFNSTADFDIGGFSGGTLVLNGRASLCFLSANYLSDVWCSYLFSSTRSYFGV